jgi:hypothetical protein
LQPAGKTAAVPNLNVVAVNKLPRMLECRVVILSEKHMRTYEMLVQPHDGSRVQPANR